MTAALGVCMFLLVCGSIGLQLNAPASRGGRTAGLEPSRPLQPVDDIGGVDRRSCWRHWAFLPPIWDDLAPRDWNEYNEAAVKPLSAAYKPV